MERGNIQSIKIQRQGKVVKHAGGEGRAKQQLVLVGVAKDEQRVGIQPRVLHAQDGARLEHELVGAEVGRLEEGELVLVREVQGASVALHDAEVDRLDSDGAVVVAVVAGGQELGAAEGSLVVEDGIVIDGDLDRDGGVDVELDVRC